MEYVMAGRKLAVSASLVLLMSGIGQAQTPATEKARTETLVQQALERYDAGIEAAARTRAAQTPQSGAFTDGPSVPMTLEDAVRHAIDNNLDIVVERLNPQTFDLTLAGLYAAYHPTATSRYGRNDVVRLPTNLLNPGTPNISSMTYNAGVTQAVPQTGGSV